MEREELLALMLKELPRLLHEHPEPDTNFSASCRKFSPDETSFRLKELYPVAHILRLHD
ncbi:hypothetical protein [Fervidibacter sacchari]